MRLLFIVSSAIISRHLRQMAQHTNTLRWCRSDNYLLAPSSERQETSRIHLPLHRERKTLRPSATNINNFAALMKMTQMCQRVGFKFNKPNY